MTLKLIFTNDFKPTNDFKIKFKNVKPTTLELIFKIDFKLVKFMRRDGKDINGGGCMKDNDGRLVVGEKDRGKLWKDHMEKIMNVENEWDQMAEADMVEGSVEEVTYV